LKAVELYQQFDRPGKVFQILGAQDGAIVQAFIEFPIELIRDGIAIEVTATSASLNKEVEIRTNTILMQMLTQFYREVVDALMLALNPRVPEVLRMVLFQMIQGGTILMRRVLESHDVQDVDDLVPHVREIISGQLPIGQLAGEIGLQGQGGFQGQGVPQGFDAGSQFPLLASGTGFDEGFVPGGNGNGGIPRGAISPPRGTPML
jgi:hypothetical protein